MNMLFYKAWIETRVRFVAGLIAAAIICIFYMEQHAWLVRMWSADMQNPHGYHMKWMPLGIHEYGWYLWHYLYDNYLQQVWALFAILFAFGGLVRERNGGTVLFSLGLPVSRRRWLFTRLAVALLQSFALSLFAVLVVVIGSAVIHQTILARAGTSAFGSYGGRWDSLSSPSATSATRSFPATILASSLPGPPRSTLPVAPNVHAAYARPRTHTVVEVFGLRTHHGRSLAIELEHHAVGAIACDVATHRSLTHGHRGPWRSS